MKVERLTLIINFTLDHIGRLTSMIELVAIARLHFEKRGPLCIAAILLRKTADLLSTSLWLPAAHLPTPPRATRISLFILHIIFSPA